MNFLDFFQKLNSNEFKGIETKLLTRRRNGTIAGWTAIISGILQVIIILVQNKGADSFIEIFKIDLESFNPGSFIPFIFLFFGLLFYFLYRRTNFLFTQSKEPYRYTFYVEPFKEVKTLVKEDFKFKNKERFKLLHHDITELICQRIKRFSVLKEYNSDKEQNTKSEVLKIPDYRESSHIHIYGNYTVREDRKNRDWIVQVMPYVRIGGIDAPARMSQTVRFPLLTNNTPEEFNTDEYNQLIERVYSRIATEIYAQIDTDIRKKIKLFPTKYLKASFLYHEAKDMAKSNTIDAFERAIILFEESRRYCDVTIRKIFNNFFIKVPVLRTLVAPYQHIMARIQIGLATSLVYKNCLSSYAGKKLNPLFAPLKDIDSVKKRLEYLHIRISLKNKFSGDINDKLTYFNLTYLTFPKDTWLRKILFQPSGKFFNENRRILFNAYVVESLIYSRLSTMEAAKRSLRMARAIAPDLCTEDARYLLAEAYIQPEVNKAISLMREATEKDPTFQIAQYELAYWMEIKFRSLNNLTKLRAKVVLDEYDKVLRLNPGNIMALAAQGYIHWLLKENGEAQRKFEEGCEIKTIVRDTFTAQLVYGLARIKAESFPEEKIGQDSFTLLNEAYDLFNQAISVDPNIGAYTVGSSIARTSSGFYYITPQIVNRYREFLENVVRGINNVKKTKNSTLHESAKEIFNSVKSYVLNEYGNACNNYYLRYGDKTYLKKSAENYKLANELNAGNVASKFNLSSAIHDLKEVDLETKTALLEEIIEEKPDWIDALGSYAISLAITLKNLEDEEQITEKSKSDTDKKSKPKDVNINADTSFQEDVTGTNTRSNITQKFDSLTKQLFNTTNRLSALYAGLKQKDKEVDELLNYKIRWELLDYDDVMALKVWANNLYFQKDKNCIKLFDHIINNYYKEDLDLNIFKKDYLEEQYGISEPIDDKIKQEINNCKKIIESDIKYRLRQDPIHYDTLMLAKTRSPNIYNDHLGKAYKAEKNPTIANHLANLYFEQEEYSDAIAYYEEAISMDSQPIYECNLGRAYGKNNDWNAMLEHCLKAVELSRNSESDYYDFDYYYEYIAIAYQKLNRLDEFIPLFEKSVDFKNIPDSQKAIVLNRVGNLFSESKQNELAIENYHKALQYDQKPIYACNLGRTYGDISEYNEMIRFCRKAVDMRINTPQDNFELDYYFDYLAEAYLNSGKVDEFSEFIDSLDYLRKDNKTKAYLLNKLGNFKANSNLNYDAIKYYEKAIELHKTPIYYGNLGIMYSRLSNWHQMMDNFSQAVKQRLEKSDDTTQISYYLKHLAKAYYKLKKIPRFISYLNLIEEMNTHPEDKAAILNQIGNFYSDDKNYPKAIHFYKIAIKLNKLAVYLNNLGRAYEKSNKPENALETLLLALDVRKQQDEGEIPLSEYYENVAFMYNKTGKIEKFEEFFERETDLDEFPEQKSVFYNRTGILYYQSRDWEKAIINYQKAIDLDDKAIYELNLGLVYGELKDWDKMIELCKKAIEIRRNKFDKNYSMKYYYEFLAQAYYNSNNATEFISYIESNNDFKDDKASKDAIYDYISGQFLIHINPKGAKDFFQRALEYNDNSKHRYKLAEAYRFSGKKEEAVEQYKICLKQQILNHEPVKRIFSTCLVLESCDMGVQNRKAIDFLEESLLETDVLEEEKEVLINDFKNHKAKVQK